MRIVFMGSPDVAVPTLNKLVGSRHEVVAVVSRPDRPVGRGRHIAACPVAARARELELPLYQPENLSSFSGTIRDLGADLGIVVAYGKILPSDLLSTLSFWNVHFSVLPKYRGAAPVQWALINGEKRTGVSVIRLTGKLDAGPILKKVEVDIFPEDDAGTLGDRLSHVGADLLMEAIDDLLKGILKEVEQEGTVTYAPLLKKEYGHIDWSLSATAIANRIHGLNPWPGAYSYWQMEMIKIYRAQPVEEVRGVEPGTMIESTGRLLVACGEGALEIEELQRPGKKRMPTKLFLEGCSIKGGFT